MQGLHGRLGDLGAIDAQYDAAASNAGRGLDYLVVDTVTQGQQILSYVRKHNLGVVNLVILEKQTHFLRVIQQPFDAPAGCVRLFDLIQCDDERLRSAFYWYARDTLVCKDIQHARHVAYAPGARRRVVTLQVWLQCPHQSACECSMRWSIRLVARVAVTKIILLMCVRCQSRHACITE